MRVNGASLGVHLPVARSIMRKACHMSLHAAHVMCLRRASLLFLLEEMRIGCNSAALCCAVGGCEVHCMSISSSS